MLVAVVLAGLSAAPANAAFVNGSFEVPPTAPGGLIIVPAGNPAIVGWTVGGSDVLVLNTTYSEPQAGGGTLVFNAQDGQNSVDLTGAGNTGANFVEQAVVTIPGVSYDLSFYVGRADGDARYATPSTVDLSIDGTPVNSFTNSNVSPLMVNWQLFTQTFTAVNALTTVRFTNATPPVSQRGNNFAGLDNVSINPTAAVPVPASALLLGSGFGLLAWRRKKA